MADTTYTVETIRLDTGERFPLLINASTLMPCEWACRWSHAYHRQKAVKTAEAELTALCRLYEWADVRGIDLEERFGSGRLFSPAEVENLSDHVRLNKNGAKLVKGRSVPTIVVGNTHKFRMKKILEFVKWRIAHMAHGVVDTLRAHDIRLRLKELVDQIKGLVRGSQQKQREALTDEELEFLVKVTHPDHPLNPFKRSTRHRNYALVLMYVELGVREGEPLVLKNQHVHMSGANPRIVIVPNPHDIQDVRADAPQVKTAGRSLPTSKPLSAAIDHFHTKVRPKTKGTKNQHFVFTTSTNGAAMSLDAVYSIFRVLRKRFPDQLPANLCPHLLRHTWNARFRAQAAARKWEEGFRDVVNNYLMGWTKTSKQGKRYGHSQIVREAEKVLLDLQVSLVGGVA